MLKKILKIEELDERELVDVEVSGNHLFYANDILTHNSSSDVELTDTSESFGLPATADLMFALISTEELEELGQIMVKQLKNRYNDPTVYKRFVVGIDRSKMRLFDVDQDSENKHEKEEEFSYEEKQVKKTFDGFKF
jgi:alpha-galactosidase/6-phospho-beta-glucosidase family protein